MRFGNYDVVACTAIFYPETDEDKTDKKSGEVVIDPATGEPIKKKKAAKFRYIWLTRGDLIIRFCGTRKGTQWSDSRDLTTETLNKRAKPMTTDQLRAELTRLLGSASHAAEVMEMVEANEVKSDEYAEMVGARYVEVPYDDGTVKRERKGGLPGRLEEMIAACKQKRAYEKTIARR